MDLALDAALDVVRALRDLRVDYLVGGSVASSLYGLPRTTNDVDIVADLKLAHIPQLVSALEASFYIDGDRARHAVERRSSFNVIYLRTMFKVDLFVLKEDLLSREEMRRRRRVTVGDGEHQIEIEVASAEDVVLQKLDWYRLGNRVSDRQWTDLLGVLKVQTDLDHDYLGRWTSELGLDDLYREALREAGLDP